MDGVESSASGRTGSNSLASCKLAYGLDNAVGELDDRVPAANFHAPSKMLFHESGVADEESAAGEVGASGTGSSAGLVDGSAAKIDSLGSVRSGVEARLANWSDTGSG